MGNKIQVVEHPNGARVETLVYEYEVGDDLSPFIEEAVFRIKSEAARAIESYKWKIERLGQRELLGLATLIDRSRLYAEIESIRQSSNAAEASVRAMTDYNEIISHYWTPNIESFVAPTLLTHVEFIKRFTPEEYQGIVAAVDSNVVVKANWNIFFAADHVNISDPKTISGIELLEYIGLIGSGRAVQILA